MKPLKLKSTASLRLRVGYFLLFTLFAAAFIASTARAVAARDARAAESHFLTP